MCACSIIDARGHIGGRVLLGMHAFDFSPLGKLQSLFHLLYNTVPSFLIHPIPNAVQKKQPFRICTWIQSMQPCVHTLADWCFNWFINLCMCFFKLIRHCWDICWAVHLLNYKVINLVIWWCLLFACWSIHSFFGLQIHVVTRWELNSVFECCNYLLIFN